MASHLISRGDWQSDIFSITKPLSICHKSNGLLTVLLPEPLSTSVLFPEECVLCAPANVPETRRHVPCIGATAKIVGHLGRPEVIVYKSRSSLAFGVLPVLKWSCHRWAALRVSTGSKKMKQNNTVYLDFICHIKAESSQGKSIAWVEDPVGHVARLRPMAFLSSPQRLGIYNCPEERKQKETKDSHSTMVARTFYWSCLINGFLEWEHKW